jgi:hypothetical protein
MRKGRPKAAFPTFLSQGHIDDQATAAAFLRRATAPRPPKPKSMSPQVAGSGLASDSLSGSDGRFSMREAPSPPSQGLAPTEAIRKAEALAGVISIAGLSRLESAAQGACFVPYITPNLSTLPSGRCAKLERPPVRRPFHFYSGG